MAFFWVQQWVALPVVYEGPMGDLPPGSRPQALDSAAAGFARDGNPSLSSTLPPYKSPDNSTPFYSQLSGIPENQLRPDYRSPTHATTQFPAGEHAASPLNMASMAGALPEYGSMDVVSATQQGSQSVPRSLPGASASAVVYQLGQNLQMSGGHVPGSMPNRHQYGTAYAAAPYQQQNFAQGSQHASYPPFAASQSRMPANTLQMGFQNYPGPSQYMYYPTPYGHQGQYNPGHPAQGAQSQAMYERGGNMSGVPMGLSSPQGVDYQHHDGTFTGARHGPGSLQSEQAAVGSAFAPSFARMQGNIFKFSPWIELTR
jgi:hypothetical protein